MARKATLSITSTGKKKASGVNKNQRSAGKPDVELGKRIRLRRVEQHISQSELSDKLGVSFQQVQKYEKGTNRISASRLQQMSNILQVPVPFFFEGAPHVPGQHKRTDEPPSPGYVSEFISSSDGLALIKAFMQIKDAKLRRSIVNLVKDIAG